MAYTIADMAELAGTPTNGLTVRAYKATRFSSIPGLNTAAPGSPDDLGAVTSTRADGGDGNFQIAVPTAEPYYVAITDGVNTAWKLCQPINATATLFVPPVATGTTKRFDRDTGVFNLEAKHFRFTRAKLSQAA